VELCVKIHTNQPMGHILVFLTGQEECERACKLLGQKVDSLFDDGIDMPDIVILPVYANLPSDSQQKIFQPTPPDVRKVLFATNICETSLTVYVII
jgi:HrpA-like RNA helicase